MLRKVVIVSCFFSISLAGYIQVEEEITTLPPPPRPYAFGYAAGRFSGHIDRTHSEVSDGNGVVQGSYAYVDPKLQIRKVDYIADRNGFHILNLNPPSAPNDTPVVAAAKHRHLVQYAKIADAHQRTQEVASVPRDSQAVQFAKNKHYTLFQKIADEHARIGAEREAQRLQEAAQHPNSVEH
ncbi:unnamed protein product [Ceutorhynchus assimilis]|uniref:Uncharacterized protein n=1 Tax=Ceutorhynchus assimilis TaxID=467358 RepID=A0A9N9MWA1_9CUCU|nr:unnamed protein product [Ceutorhynchus assimilis]